VLHVAMTPSLVVLAATLTTLFPVLLLLALSTLGGAIMVRSLPWPKAWLQAKPLGCPACMSGWSGIAHLMVASGLGLFDAIPGLFVVPIWLALVAFAAPIFAKLYPPPLDLSGLDGP
jgi:hypothetical protein